MTFRSLAFTVATAIALAANAVSANAALPGERAAPKGVKSVQICEGAGLSRAVQIQNPKPEDIRAWESLCVGIYQAIYISTFSGSAWDLANGIRKKYIDKGETLDFTKDLIDPFKYRTGEDFVAYWAGIDKQLTQLFATERAKMKQQPEYRNTPDAQLNGMIQQKGMTAFQTIVEKVEVDFRNDGRTFQGFHALIIARELLRVNYDLNSFSYENFANETNRIEKLLLEKRGDAPRPANIQYGSTTAVLRSQAG